LLYEANTICKNFIFGSNFPNATFHEKNWPSTLRRKKTILKEGEDEQNYCVNVNNLLCKVESQSSCPFPVSGQPELPELIEIFEAVSIMEKDGGQFSTSFETREREQERDIAEKEL